MDRGQRTPLSSLIPIPAPSADLASSGRSSLDEDVSPGLQRIG